MKKTLTLGLALCMVSITSAQWGKKIKGNGNMVTMERTTADYEEISVAGFFDVDLVSGTEGNLLIEAEENLQEYIITEVKGDKLTIKVKNGVNLRPSSWNDGIRITVPVTHISALSLSGSGDVTSSTPLKSSDFSTHMSGSGDITLTIESDKLSATMSGSGDIRLSGVAKQFYVQISGSGDVSAFDLEADEVDANISGSADIQVTANQALKARVSGSGDIRYRGNPEKIDTKASGSGDISRG